MPCFISMAAIYTYFYTYISDSVSNHSFPSPIEFFENPQKAMFFVSFFFTVSFISLLILSFFLYKKQRKTVENQNTRNPNQSDPEEFEGSLAKITQEKWKADPTHLTNSLLLEILHSDSPKWVGLLGNKCEDPESNGSGEGGKRKKKRARKKRLGLGGEENHGKEENLGLESGCRVKPELVCLYPFTSSTSATQRKIKQQYDQLVKCNESNGLTLAEVGHFANCLIEAKKELQHKSEVIQRKFTITKALLFKADRSSLDRLRQQIYKLEIEQKRLEEDSAVYNWLQHQLKLSPAYKKMLEISDSMELKAKSDNLMESTDTEYAEISFEELLAQEKKDSFWQRNGKSRPCSS